MKKDLVHEELQKKKKEIQAILDRDYFSTSVQIKNDKTLSWKVTYCNLADKAYRECKNNPLLNSDENRISDIYKLRDKFENEKKKEIMKNLHEIVPIISQLNRSMNNIVNIFFDFFICVFIAKIGLLYWMLFFDISAMFMLGLVILEILLCIAGIKYGKVIQRERINAVKEFERLYIKEKIKRLGMFFVDRIKN